MGAETGTPHRSQAVARGPVNGSRARTAGIVNAEPSPISATTASARRPATLAGYPGRLDEGHRPGGRVRHRQRSTPRRDSPQRSCAAHQRAERPDLGGQHLDRYPTCARPLGGYASARVMVLITGSCPCRPADWARPAPVICTARSRWTLAGGRLGRRDQPPRPRIAVLGCLEGVELGVLGRRVPSARRACLVG